MDRDRAVAEFDAMYAAEWGRLAGVLALVCGDRRTAEETAQETFARAWSHWRTVTRLDRPAGWLYTTGFRLVRRRMRRLDARTTVTATLPETATVDDLATLDRVTLTRALAALPDRQREAVVAHHVLGLSSAEVGAALGVTDTAARQLVHRGITALRASTELEPSP